MDIRAVIVDDEQLARGELCFQLQQLGGVEVVGLAGNGVQALQLVEDLSPDLVLLDVQMPGRTGFDVARELLARGCKSRVVFVTAYDEYAIEAFDVNAVDYVLKPIEPARLSQAIQRIRDQLAESRGTISKGVPAADEQAPLHPMSEAELERLIKHVAQRHSRRTQLAVKVSGRFLLIPSEDIIYVSLTDDVITIVTGALSGTSNCRTLDELQLHLDPEAFWRVNRSHLVNINKIKEIIPWFSRNYVLKMKDLEETEIPVSRAQTKRLREHLRL